MGSLNNRSKAFLGLILFGIFGTLLSHFTGLDPGPIAPISSILTIGAGVAALFPTREEFEWKPWMIGILIGGVAEICGIYTGYPFGRYQYTDKWFPTVPLPGGVSCPLMLPLAWLMIAGASDRCCERLYPTSRIVAAGLLAALVDLVMEPVMVNSLGYWKWVEPGPLPGGAPILNFVGWWLTASLLSFVFTRHHAHSIDPQAGATVLVGHLALMGIVFFFPAVNLVPSPHGKQATARAVTPSPDHPVTELWRDRSKPQGDRPARQSEIHNMANRDSGRRIHRIRGNV